VSLCGTTGLDLESNLVETRIKNSDMVLITESELNVSAIDQRFWHCKKCGDNLYISEKIVKLSYWQVTMMQMCAF
jgi:hypothetical protein